MMEKRPRAERVEEVVIVGGGIAGLATALALNRVGKSCLILERWHELRESGAALGLHPNAWRALHALGIAQKLIPNYRAVRSGRVTNLETGSVRTQSLPRSSDGEEKGARAVHRKVLLEVLAEEIPQEAIRFSSRLASIRTEVGVDSSSITVLQLEDGDIIKAKVVIGCDGLHSVVAQWLGLAPPRDSGRSAVRGLAVFPEGHGLKHEAQLFLLANKRVGLIPLNDHDAYWFISHPTTPKVIFGSFEAVLRSFFDGEKGDRFALKVSFSFRSRLRRNPFSRLFGSLWEIAGFEGNVLPLALSSGQIQ